MVPKAGLGTSTMRHCDVPRFGALVRDKTPTPADLTVSNNSATMVLLELYLREEEGSLVSPSSLNLVGCGVNANRSVDRLEWSPLIVQLP